MHSELCLLVASGGNQLPCVEKSLLAVDDKFQRQKYWGQPATTSRRGRPPSPRQPPVLRSLTLRLQDKEAVLL